MKARLNKGNGRKQKNTMVALERNIHQMSVPEIIKCVSGWVEKDFYTTVEHYENDKSITSADILIGMMADNYLREFPKSVWKHVKLKVAEMMNKRLKIALDDVIQVECKKRGISKQEAINQIKNSDDFIKCIFPEDEIPPFYKEKMQETIDSYIQELETELNDKAEENVIEEAEPVTIVEKSDESIDELIEQEDIALTEMTKEEQFVEAVRTFTNDFEFLAEDVKSYLANKGHRDTELPIRQVIGKKEFNLIHAKNPSAKFKSVEDAIRFIKIQEVVRNMMPTDENDEEKAVIRIINTLDKKETNKTKKMSNKKEIFKVHKKTQLEGILENLDVTTEESEFIKSVLGPICKSRLEVMNKFKDVKNEDIDR